MATDSNDGRADDLDELPFVSAGYAAGGTGEDDVGGLSAAEVRPLSVGTTLADRYEIKECIGIGGMGVVYRAYDRERSEEIAVKTMHPRLLDRPKARAAFEKEAALACELHHASIVQTYGTERWGRTSLITMELLRGRSLRQELDSLATVGSSMRFDRAMEITREVCAALEYAHDRMVHRDVKPGNIFLCDDGRVKLLDFGIARLTQGEDGTTTSGSTGLGTAYYVAPELIQGAREIDHRADQFGLAATAYEMLTGQLPVGAIRPVHQIREDVGKTTSDAIMRAIADHPSRRHTSMAEFSQALQGRRLKRFFVAGGAVAAATVAMALARPLVQGPVEAATSTAEGEKVVAAPEPASPQLLNQVEAALQVVAGHESGVRARARDASANADPRAAEVWSRLEVSMDSHLLAGGGAESAVATGAFYREFRSDRELPGQDAEALRDALAWATRTRAVLEVAPRLVQDCLKIATADGEQSPAIGTLIDEGNWQQAADVAKEALLLQRERDAVAERRGQVLTSAVGLEGQLSDEARESLQAIANAKMADSGMAALETLDASLNGVKVEIAAAQAERGAAREGLAAAFELGADLRVVQGHELPLRITHRVTGVAFRLVLPGRFKLGDGAGPAEERPEVEVEVDAFYLAEEEVSVEQWAAVQGRTHAGASSQSHPVVNVAWADAQSWCDGNGMRLPTEAEWEWAACGEEERTWPWGNAWTDGTANSAGGRLAPTSTFAGDVGPFGHLGLAGNVAEWCADGFRVNHRSVPMGIKAMNLQDLAPDSASASGRVIRGGSYRSYRGGCKATTRREGAAPEEWIGFRPAYSIPQ